MDCTKEVFARMDIAQIVSFILYGSEEYDLEKQSYMDRLNKGSDSINKRLKCIYTDEDEHNYAYADLSKAFDAYERVYMEIGMKAGARLMYQLLLFDNYSE